MKDPIDRCPYLRHRFFGGLLLMLASVLFLVGCQREVSSYVPGTYRGETEGYYSPMIVDVTVDEHQITGIEVIALDETPIITETVIEKLPKRIIKANSTQVDIISGATATSKGMIKAVEDALRQARKD